MLSAPKALTPLSAEIAAYNSLPPFTEGGAEGGG
ncbi:hypothetical protein AM305_04353, partial [Actinobacillus minor NM305]